MLIAVTLRVTWKPPVLRGLPNAWGGVAKALAVKAPPMMKKIKAISI
jgi:hypothetical protein